MRQRINSLSILVLVSATALAAQTTSGTGSLSGTIVDESGRPVAGAKLSYTKVAEYFRDQSGRLAVKDLGFGGEVMVGADGRFTLSNLPRGNYSLCAWGTRPNQVGSCEWHGLPVVTLAPGQNIGNLTRILREGAILTLRVADPLGRILVPDSNGKILVPSRRFFIGATSESGFYRRAEVISRTPSQHVFQLRIPKQGAARLFIDSELTVTDGVGNQLETKRRTTRQITPGASDQVTFDLRVN
ncbi:MAG: carboxypeptidase-like regulatory domain-containing protein [Bryobacteraceae bacterium]